MGSLNRAIPVVLLVLSLSFSVCIGRTKGEGRGKNIRDLFFNPRVGPEEIKKAVILPIRSNDSQRKYASAITDWLTQGFRETQKYDLSVTRELTKLIEEWGMDLEEIHHYTRALEIGKSVGADGVITSSLAQYGIMGERARFGINLRMTRIPEGDTVWSTSCSASGNASEMERIAHEGIESIIQALVSQWQSNQATVAWGMNLEPLQTSGGYRHIAITVPQYRESEIKAYIIERSTSKSGPFKEIKQLSVKKRGSLVFKDGDVKVDRSYFYRYRAVAKSRFTSPFSDVIEAGLAVVPVPPEGLMATGDKIRQIRLDWEKSADRDVSGYRIYRSRSPDRDYKLIVTVKRRNTTRYIDKGDDKNPLGDGVQYFYRIAAFYPSGKESQKSEATSATTPPE